MINSLRLLPNTDIIDAPTKGNVSQKQKNPLYTLSMWYIEGNLLTISYNQSKWAFPWVKDKAETPGRNCAIGTKEIEREKAKGEM